MSSENATRRGRPTGWRSMMRHSVTGPDQSGYASKSVSTAKQSSSEPATSVVYDCEKSLTRGRGDRGVAAAVKERGGRSRAAVVCRAVRVCSARETGLRMPVRTSEWRNGRVVMLDRRVLPTREVYRVYTSHRDVARAMKDMVVR